jgi:hypothetical protein
MWIDFRNKNMFRSCIVKLKWTNSNVATSCHFRRSPVFDGLFHVIKSIQHDVYIWANYSVSSYLNFIPICWNVSIWLKYDFMHIFIHHLFLYFETTAHIPEVEFGGKYGYMRANTDRANNQHWLLAIIGHAKTNILQQNMW